MASTVHRFLHGDARDLAGVPDASVDLVVTSPPYPMIAMWDDAFAGMDPAIGRMLDAGDGKGAHAAMHGVLDRAWAEAARSLREGGLACVNVGDATRTVGGVFRLYANASRIVRAFEALGFDTLPKILWRKTTNAPTKFMGSGMLPPGAYVTLEHEVVLIFRKGGPRRFAGAEEKANRRASAFFWEERNRWFCDLWELHGARQELGDAASRRRSGAFPLELPLRLVLMHSVKGDTVLDPFAGTGTTLLACMAFERHGLGVESDAALAGDFLARSEGAAGALNARIEERLRAHEAFMAGRPAARGGGPYRNGPHGFPVVTRQETELRIRRVGGIRRRGGGIEVEYGA